MRNNMPERNYRHLGGLMISGGHRYALEMQNCEGSLCLWMQIDGNDDDEARIIFTTTIVV